jgi:hypothetical protein
VACQGSAPTRAGRGTRSTSNCQTGNAASNQYMIALNEQLGFRVTGTFQNWEIKVAAARKLAG